MNQLASSGQLRASFLRWALVLVLAVYDAALSPVLLAGGLAGAACVSALLGFVVVAFFDDLYAFILPMIGTILLLGAPGYAVLLGIAPAWLVWHPTAGSLALIQAAFEPGAAQHQASAIVSIGLWTATAAALAYMAVRRMRSRIGGS